MSFGENLKTLRETNRITQDELAKHLQVTRPTIAGYETKGHEPDYEKLRNIAHYFGVSIDYLIEGPTTMQVQMHPDQSEQELDQNVLTAYQSLSLPSKQDTLKHIQLLQLRDERDNASR